ncbi:UNVERIFIED_CONTAM: hypothetical protein GTU68_035081 [Idotea baltica]|nr:hypothetical protein [Idotea baltica]
MPMLFPALLLSRENPLWKPLQNILARTYCCTMAIWTGLHCAP